MRFKASGGRSWFGLFAFLIMTLPSLYAQETRASLSGTITDPSGSAVVGAQVTLRNTATNLTITGAAGADGRYVLPQLDPGPYELTAESQGFRKHIRAGIYLRTGDKANINVNLEIGSVADSVTVSAELTGIETNSSVMGQLLDTRQVGELPLNGRSFINLLELSAGVLFTAQVGVSGWGGTRQFEGSPGGNPTSIHGGLPSTNAVLMDGAPLGVQGGDNYVPLSDSIAEVKVVSPTSDASHGLSGGGVIMITMKSGTNETHGVISHFLQNTIFDAVPTQTNRAAAQDPSLKRIQHQWNAYSANLQGPIIKNKFFYSVYLDGFRQRQPFPMTVTLPTLAQRAGDFSQSLNASGQLVVVYDPLSTKQSGSTFTRTPFGGNRLPAERMVAVAKNILKYVPDPNVVGNAVTNLNNFTLSPNTAQFLYDSYYGKFDYVWNSSQRTTGTLTQNWGKGLRSTNGIPIGNPLMAGIDPRTRTHLGVIADHTYAINSSMVLTGRLAVDRWVGGVRSDTLDKVDGSKLGFQGVSGSSPVVRIPVISMTDYTNLAMAGPSLDSDNVYSAVSDLSVIAGRHSVKIGVRAGQVLNSNSNAGNIGGNFAFTKGFTQRDPQRADSTSGNAMAAFLLGYPNSGNTVVNASSTVSNRFLGLYVQDDFKATSRLTLNFGLRWDVQTAPTERFNRNITGFDPTVKYQLGSAQAQGGLTFADPNSRQPWSTNWRDFQPRFGVAYQSSRRLVFRAGYGLSVLPLNAPGGSGGVTQTGFSRTTPLVATLGGGVNAYTPGLPGTGTLLTPFPNGILQPFGASLGTYTNVGQSISFVDEGYVIPRVHQFHFGLGYELPWQTSLDVAYVGTRTRKYPVSKSVDAISLDERLKGVADPNYLNAAVANPFAGAPELAGTGLAGANISRAQSLLPFAQFTGITNQGLSLGSTSYNGLESKLNKRFSEGLTWTVSYTWAKVLQEDSYMEPQYTSLERVLASFDRPHHLTVNMIYELPVGRGKTLGNNWGAALESLLGNWQYTAVVQKSSGESTAMPGARPVGDPRMPAGQQSYSSWFNPCTLLTNGNRSNCATADQPVAWVQLKPNELRDFSTQFPNLRKHSPVNINTSISKTFRIRERVRLQLRAEAFNAFNTPQYGGPTTSFTSSNFGQVLLDQLNFARYMQWALRLMF